MLHPVHYLFENCDWISKKNVGLELSTLIQKIKCLCNNVLYFFTLDRIFILYCNIIRFDSAIFGQMTVNKLVAVIRDQISHFDMSEI